MRVPFGWLVFLGTGLLVLVSPVAPSSVVASGFVFQQSYKLTDSVQEPAPSWPLPKKLIEQIDSLRQVPQFATWAAQTIPLLEAVTDGDRGFTDRQNILHKLEFRRRNLAGIAWAVGESSASSDESIRQASEIFRIDYCLARRLAVWNALSRKAPVTKSGELSRRTSTVAWQNISFPTLDASWAKYLMLDEVESAFGSLNPNPKQQKKISRRVLARIHSPVLSPQQAAYILQVIDPSVMSMLKDHASEPTDANSLLVKMEAFESNPTSSSAYYLNNEYQNLLWSDDPADQAIARNLETHFRNANFRMVVSDELMNRVIPVMPSVSEPVSENIEGAKVTGISEIANRIRVKLVPDPTQLKLRLETDVEVHSRTTARTKTFRILNVGEARALVFKHLSIGRNGVDSTELPYSVSEANQSVVGVSSRLDDIPIVGWMARRLAERKLRDQDAETDQMFRRRVARSAESRVQQEVETHLGELRKRAYSNVVQPLMNMDLEPHPYQMSTTDHQVVVRYRLAGRDQMAAFTSRPQDSGNSLLSFQLHQSAINNAIARIGLKGEKFTSEELVEHLQGVFGRETTETDSSQSTNQGSKKSAEFAFAYFDPIRVNFIEDRVNVVLNLKSLKVGKKGKTWKYLRLTVSYRIEASGMKIRLVRDEDARRVKRVGKPLRLGDKAAIYTVMGVLFKKKYSFDAIPESLSKKLGAQAMEVSHLVLADGWLGVSIDDPQVTSEAKLDSPKSRLGTIRRMKKVR